MIMDHPLNVFKIIHIADKNNISHEYQTTDSTPFFSVLYVILAFFNFLWVQYTVADFTSD